MPESEQANTRILPPIVWGEGYAQPCLADCGNVLKLDQLEDGDIWACARCRAGHEFYTAYVSGPGGRIKYGLCRLLIGDHRRAAGEPSILEFVKP